MALDGIKTFDQNKIANEFNKSFTEIGPELTCSTPISSRDFNQFWNVLEVLEDEELDQAFNSLKSYKNRAFDDISPSVVNFCISGIFHQF